MRRGDAPMTARDFLDNFDTERSARPAPVVIGPRTHGVTDANWDADVRTFRSQTCAHNNETRTEATAPVSDLTMALAAWTDPALPFRTNAEGTARAWMQETLKPAYQAVRVPQKRPWPEFAASIRSGFGFTPPDAAAIALAVHIDIASSEQRGLVVGPRSLDADFESRVLDVQTAATTALGHVCERAVRDAGADGRALARALSMNTRNLSGRALDAAVAARHAALQSWSRGCA